MRSGSARASVAFIITAVIDAGLSTANSQWPGAVRPDQGILAGHMQVVLNAESGSDTGCDPDDHPIVSIGSKRSFAFRRADVPLPAPCGWQGGMADGALCARSPDAYCLAG